MIRIRDVMTVGVVSVEPETTLAEVTRLLMERRISGVPVIRDGELLGIVTKTDLLREDDGADDERTVADVMTSDVVTLTEGMLIAEAARIMVRHGIRRAPVLRDGRVVGIVSQSDLLRPHLRTDAEILADIESGVLAGALGISPRIVVTRVLDGVVFLQGSVHSDEQHVLLRRLVTVLPGVVDLIDHVQVAPMAAIGRLPT